MPEISIIVPVYNVEPYLRKCIDSLLAQTLKDIEIILIDDGSTDASGAICDRYSEADGRIKLIHKANEGLSCARNDGIDAAASPYLMFVDSDDWVDPGFCEIPYKAAEENGADLVLFRSCSVKNGKRLKKKKSALSGELDAETALKHGGVVVWNKLYRRELFSEIRFPPGRYYEDLAVTHKIVFAAKRIFRIDDILYFHRERKNGLSRVPSAKYLRDGFVWALERAEYLSGRKCSPETYDRLLYRYSLAFLVKAYPCDDPVYIRAEEVTDSIVGIPPWLPPKRKAMLAVWKIDRRVFHFLCGVLGQKDKRYKYQE